jgi:outer membrane protein assembly factor BamB
VAGISRDLLFVGIKGHVIAMERLSGRERWRTRLSGSDFVHLIDDGARLFASVAGRIYCVDPTTGSVLWENPLKGMGLGIASLLAPGTEGAHPELLAAAGAKRRQQSAAAAG